MIFLAPVTRRYRPCCHFLAELGRYTMNQEYRLVGPM